MCNVVCNLQCVRNFLLFLSQLWRQRFIQLKSFENFEENSGTERLTWLVVTWTESGQGETLKQEADWGLLMYYYYFYYYYIYCKLILLVAPTTLSISILYCWSFVFNHLSFVSFLLCWSVKHVFSAYHCNINTHTETEMAASL